MLPMRNSAAKRTGAAAGATSGAAFIVALAAAVAASASAWAVQQMARINSNASNARPFIVYLVFVFQQFLRFWASPTNFHLWIIQVQNYLRTPFLALLSGSISTDYLPDRKSVV